MDLIGSTKAVLLMACMREAKAQWPASMALVYCAYTTALLLCRLLQDAIYPITHQLNACNSQAQPTLPLLLLCLHTASLLQPTMGMPAALDMQCIAGSA